MATTVCPKCGGEFRRVSDREYVLSKGWKFVPWTPGHKRNTVPFVNPEHPHDGFELSSAVIRQNFYDSRDTLPIVKCLWWGIVRDIYVNGELHNGPLIGNPSGYNDWGYSLIPYKGELDGEKYDYVQGGKV